MKNCIGQQSDVVRHGRSGNPWLVQQVIKASKTADVEMIGGQVCQPVRVNIQVLLDDAKHVNLPKVPARTTVLAVDMLTMASFNQSPNLITPHGL